MGVRVDKSQANSVTSGTSDCFQKTAFLGSNPQAKKSKATSNICLKHSGHGVIIGNEIIGFAFLLHGNSRFHHAEIISDM